MASLRRLFFRLLNATRPRRAEPDLDRELAAHLRLLEDEYRRRGLSADDAKYAARRSFGSVELTKQLHRDARSFLFLDHLLRDLRYAARALRRAPAFTMTVIATLAIGFGMNTAVFSLADASLIDPLPFPDPDRLVTVHEVVPLIGQRPIRLTAPDLLDYEEQTYAFTALGGWTPQMFELSGARESVRVQAVRATASLFAVLPATPARGRIFTRDEEHDGARVCVIGDGLWRRWFGADPTAIGRSLDLDRVPWTVIGIMPREFEFPLRGAETAFATDLWVPMSLTPRERAARQDNWSDNGVARMKPGIGIREASADVNLVARRIATDLGRQAIAFGALVRPMADPISSAIRPLVLVLLGAVVCVLLVACLNVTNLLLARGAHREGEIAIRLALGATRARLLTQLVTETLFMGSLAALAGGVLAWWSTRALARVVPTRFAVLAQATVNWRVVLFAVIITVAGSVIVGVVPGLAAIGPARTGAGRSAVSRSTNQHTRVRATLTVVEVALALVLLIGAGLLARTFRDLLRTTAGFEPEGAVAGLISLPEHEFPDAASERQFYRGLLERLYASPGTAFAGVGVTLPLNGRRNEKVLTPEDYTPSPNARFNIVGMTTVGGEYLQAIGATLRRGRYFTADESRYFTPDDRGTAPPVAIVTDSFVRQFWPEQDPIGKRLKWGTEESRRAWITVVGVVADVKQDSLDRPAALQVYMPNDQGETSAAVVSRDLRSMFVVVRGRGATAGLQTELREAVRSLDTRLAVADLQPLAESVSRSAAPQRFNMLLMSGFAAMALVLATIGIYGVVAYSVARRTREIGIRMTLGADPRAVVWMVLRGGLTLAVIGIALGTVAAAALSPALTSLLFGVKPLDPLTFASVSFLLLVVTALATYVPARRATRVDPSVALRCE
jgi:predicted permease